MGRLVHTLVEAHQTAGEKTVYWDYKNLNNRMIANGIYFLKLEGGDYSQTKKILLIQ
jgi:hypothetical protein